MYRWQAGYVDILPPAMGAAEYDTARAGGFEPLRFVPKGKTVVLGLVTTKEGRLETPGELLRRIRRPGNLLSRDDQRRKLELVVATARKIWG
jgi:5-methyltetrahydropteroyltriglutamate--homocysteine methyltransferase